MNANADKQDTNKDRRRAELGKIHIGKKQLFEDDGAYRDMLEAVAGVRSAAVLDEAGRRKVLEHMRACGAQFRPARDKAAERPVAPPETARLVWKIRSLLGDRPEKYAEEILRRRGGVLNAGGRTRRRAEPLPVDSARGGTLTLESRLMSGPPKSWTELCDLLGEAGAQKMVDGFGGEEFCVPRKYEPNHLVARQLGSEAFSVLVRFWGGCRARR